MSQCKGTTKSGDRCQHEAGAAEYCWQHGENDVKKRASKFNDITRKKILDKLHDGAPLRLAAEGAGISEKTLERWRKRFPDFAEDCREAMASGATEIVSAIRKVALDGNWKAGAWLLKKRYPELFADVDLTDEDLTDEERKERVRQILGDTGT